METSGKPKNTNGIPIIEGVTNRTFTKEPKEKLKNYIQDLLVEHVRGQK